jgi:MYXO-CTERM domain-containing protein
MGVDPMISVIALQGNAIDFGKVKVGTTSDSTQVFVVNNNKVDQTVVVSTVAPFAVDQTAPVMLPRNGGRATIAVTFSPTAAGKADGTIKVLLPMATSPLATVPLHGEGTTDVTMGADASMTPIGRNTGCAIGGSSPTGAALLLGLLVVGLVGRRRRRG